MQYSLNYSGGFRLNFSEDVNEQDHNEEERDFPGVLTQCKVLYKCLLMRKMLQLRVLEVMV